MVKTNADAVVIGAGLSGLKAADVLLRAGRRVIVLEARSRIGGRVMGGALDGHVIDHGAQWVSPRHGRLLGEARRFGLETVLQHADGRNILSLNGRRGEFVGDVANLPALALVELAMLRRRWEKEARTLPADAPWTARHAKEWDSQTLETWIQKNLSTASSRSFARLVPAVYGARAPEVSYLWMVEMLRSTEGPEQAMTVKAGVMDARFKGGAQTLAQHLADALGESLVLSAPVSAIMQDGSGIVAKSGAGEFAAAHAIVAVPPSLCQPIALDGISPHRRALQQRMPQTAEIGRAHV